MGCNEVAEMNLQLFLAVAVVALDGRLLDRAAHALDLAVGPRVVHLGQAMLDPSFITIAVKYLLHRKAVQFTICEPDELQLSLGR